MKARFSLKVIVLIGFITTLLFPWIPASAYEGRSLPAFSEFVSRVKEGQAGVINGVYIPGVMAEKVVQQSANNPGYVSPVEGVVTQFRMAMSYGVIGLLAHDNLAGENFINMQVGQEVQIIYGDGKISYYTIRSINSYQALDSHSTSSNFVDLNTGIVYTAAKIFSTYYQGGDQVTFQTCIAKDGDLSWGRLFVTATPSSPDQSEMKHPLAFHPQFSKQISFSVNATG